MPRRALLHPRKRDVGGQFDWSWRDIDTAATFEWGPITSMKCQPRLRFLCWRARGLMRGAPATTVRPPQRIARCRQLRRRLKRVACARGGVCLVWSVLFRVGR